MKLVHLIICFLNAYVQPKLSDVEKLDLCRSLNCNESIVDQVCGIRIQNDKNQYKLFDNECLLLKYGCQANDDEAYGIINMENCNDYTLHENSVTNCVECSTADYGPVCGLRSDGNGFRVRAFDNDCELSKYNCEKHVQFIVTDYYLCEEHEMNLTSRIDDYVAYNATDGQIEYPDTRLDENKQISYTTTEPQEKKNKTHLIVVKGSMFDMQNINNTVHNFFTATHVLDMPIREVNLEVDESTRRRLVKRLGPLKIFEPWVKIPANISEDRYHLPTIATCFHKCPKKCPDTYAPVCGRPGNFAREPSLMFQNHCYMDVAQCKMFLEDKSETAVSSAYVESSFLFCLGETVNGLYRFLPLIRTLQHMGRLKVRGHYRYKFRNMRFFNDYMIRDMHPMG